MRKFLHWMLSAILICGTSVFASCNNDDNPVDNPSTKKVDLATLTADYTAQDGDILIGILANPVKITVADGARITIDGAYINDKGTVYNELEYAGITCLGDATITLNDSNRLSRHLRTRGPHAHLPGQWHSECPWQWWKPLHLHTLVCCHWQRQSG